MSLKVLYKEIILAVLISLIHCTLMAQDPTEIVRKSDEKLRGKSSHAIATMSIVRPDWSRNIDMKMWSMGDSRSLVLITAPARDKGTATLMRNKEIWNWQPRIERVVKLPPSMMMQSWMGSDFTNDDLVKQSSIVKDYTHTLKKDTIINSLDCYKIEMIPKDGAPVVWGKIDIYISKVEYLQLLVRFFDEDGYLVNTMIASKIKNMGGKNLPSHLEMIPADNPKQKTVFEYHSMEFDIEVDDDFFSLQNMKRVR